MFINFYLFKFSFLMFVSVMIGLDKIKEIYKIVIEKKYCFYFYGDGMLIL